MYVGVVIYRSELVSPHYMIPLNESIQQT